MTLKLTKDNLWEIALYLNFDDLPKLLRLNREYLGIFTEIYSSEYFWRLYSLRHLEEDDFRLLGEFKEFKEFKEDNSQKSPYFDLCLLVYKLSELKSLFQFEKGVYQLYKATDLNLSHKGLTALPASIGILTNLQQLNLGSNALVKLPVSICKLTNLRKLGLYSNMLTELPEEIGNLSSLLFLSLSGNQLTTLPSSIGELTNLNILYLSDNKLSELPPEIGYLRWVHILDLANNLLATLPSSIGDISDLIHLYLQGNPLHSLPVEISNLNYLEIIYLDYVQIRSVIIPTEIGILSNLHITFNVNRDEIDDRGLPVLPPQIDHLSKEELKALVYAGLPIFHQK